MPTPSSAWDEIAGDYAERVEPLTSSFASALLDLAGDLEDRRLLDVAAGCGAVSVIAAADHGASVTATDYSAAMLDVLSSRPAWRFERSNGTATLETVVADGEALPAEWADCFDVAVSSFGCIFFPDPVQGVREMLRCVKPGAQVLVSAWGSPDETAAFQVIPTAAAAVVPAALLPAAKPKRADGSPDGLRTLFAAAGAGDVQVHGPVARTLRVADAAAYWERFARAAPGTRALLAALSDEAAAALKARVIESLEARFGAGAPVELEAKAYFCSGRKLTPFQSAVVAGTEPRK